LAISIETPSCSVPLMPANQIGRLRWNVVLSYHMKFTDEFS
jgi:hypothetical protein